MRGFESKCESQRPPAAAEVEELTSGRRCGDMVQQHSRTHVDALGAEDPVRRHQLVCLAGELNGERPQVHLALGRRGKVVISAGHKQTVQDTNKLGLTRMQDTQMNERSTNQETPATDIDVVARVLANADSHAGVALFGRGA